jgi:hypothetical protein
MLSQRPFFPRHQTDIRHLSKTPSAAAQAVECLMSKHDPQSHKGVAEGIAFGGFGSSLEGCRRVGDVDLADGEHHKRLLWQRIQNHSCVMRPNAILDAVRQRRECCECVLSI